MHAPINHRRFAFDHVFEMPAPTLDGVSDETLRLRIATLEAELALIRHDSDQIAVRARDDGFEAGLAEAREDQGAALLAVADALHAAIEGVEAQLDDIADTATREAVSVAQAAAEMLAGRALAETPTVAIDEAIGRALRQVQRGQEIHVAVAPALVAEMEALIAIRQAGDRRRLAIVIAPDPAIAIGDAHIDWDRGGVVLDAAARAAAVHDVLAPLLAPASTPAAA